MSTSNGIIVAGIRAPSLMCRVFKNQQEAQNHHTVLVQVVQKTVKTQKCNCSRSRPLAPGAESPNCTAALQLHKSHAASVAVEYVPRAAELLDDTQETEIMIIGILLRAFRIKTSSAASFAFCSNQSQPFLASCMASSASGTPKYVTLVSAEGHAFIVDYKCAMTSKTIKGNVHFAHNVRRPHRLLLQPF
jgi:hypothetical protein